jgi:hypothetical protein
VLSKFPRSSKLPFEFRLKLWKVLLPGPRILQYILWVNALVFSGFDDFFYVLMLVIFWVTAREEAKGELLEDFGLQGGSLLKDQVSVNETFCLGLVP